MNDIINYLALLILRYGLKVKLSPPDTLIIESPSIFDGAAPCWLTVRADTLEIFTNTGTKRRATIELGQPNSLDLAVLTAISYLQNHTKPTITLIPEANNTIELLLNQIALFLLRASFLIRMTKEYNFHIQPYSTLQGKGCCELKLHDGALLILNGEIQHPDHSLGEGNITIIELSDPTALTTLLNTLTRYLKTKYQLS